MDAINKAFDEYRKAVEAEKALAAQVASESRVASPEEKEKFERMEADIAAWKSEVDRLITVQERAPELDAARARMEQFITAQPAGAENRVQTDADHLVRMAKDFRDSGTLGFFDSHYSPAVLRALSTPGGTAVPTTLIDQVVVYEVADNPMLNPAIVTVIPTNSGEQLDFPRLTANPVVGATLTAEAGGLTAADPTISKVSLNAYKFAGLTIWSSELDQDNIIGLQDLIASSLAEDIGRGINAVLTTGDGSNKPQGFIGVATNGGTASGTANNPFVGGSDLIDLFYSRKAAYRNRGVWQASSTGMAKARKLQDSTGQFLWQPSLAAGQPETLLGRPIYENADMAAVASASKSFAFGDFKRFYVRKVNPARVELSRDYRFSTDELAIRVIERVDGDLIDASAIAYLVSANA